MLFNTCIINKIKNVTPHFKFYLRKVFIVAFSLFLCLTSFTSVHAVDYVDASTFTIPDSSLQFNYIFVRYYCYSAKVNTFGNGLSGIYLSPSGYSSKSYSGVVSDLVFDCTDFTPLDGYFTLIYISPFFLKFDSTGSNYLSYNRSTDKYLHTFIQFPLDFDSTLWCTNSSCSSVNARPFTNIPFYFKNQKGSSYDPPIYFQEGLSSSEDGKHLYSGDSSYWSLAFTNSNKVSYLIQANYVADVYSISLGNSDPLFTYAGDYYKPEYASFYAWSSSDPLPLSSVDGSDSASSVWDNIDFQDGNNLGSDWLSKFNFSIFNPFAILIPIFIDEATFCPATLSEWLHLDNTMCVSSPWSSEIRQPMTVAFNILISCFLFGFLINWLRNGVAPFENSISPVNFDNSISAVPVNHSISHLNFRNSTFNFHFKKDIK